MFAGHDTIAAGMNVCTCIRWNAQFYCYMQLVILYSASVKRKDITINI